MTAWLIETLVWTAVLIAAVLFVRRPVARWFGPQVAYALWALPVLRLILPPIELPAWMAPVQASEPAQGSDPSSSPSSSSAPIERTSTDGNPVM